MLWNGSPSFKVEIITHSEYSIHALVKVTFPSLSFLLTTIYASPHFNKRKFFGIICKILLMLYLYLGFS